MRGNKRTNEKENNCNNTNNEFIIINSMWKPSNHHRATVRADINNFNRARDRNNFRDNIT